MSNKILWIFSTKSKIWPRSFSNCLDCVLFAHIVTSWNFNFQWKKHLISFSLSFHGSCVISVSSPRNISLYKDKHSNEIIATSVVYFSFVFSFHISIEQIEQSESITWGKQSIEAMIFGRSKRNFCSFFTVDVCVMRDDVSFSYESQPHPKSYLKQNVFSIFSRVLPHNKTPQNGDYKRKWNSNA